MDTAGQSITAESGPQEKRRRLSRKQQLFIDKYIECHFNATEAAIQAGYGKGNRIKAGAIGRENLRKDIIKSRIDTLLSTHSNINPSEILSELRRLAFHAEKESDRIRALELLGKTSAVNLFKEEDRQAVGVFTIIQGNKAPSTGAVQEVGVSTSREQSLKSMLTSDWAGNPPGPTECNNTVAPKIAEQNEDLVDTRREVEI
jgi:hypothetical protein